MNYDIQTLDITAVSKLCQGTNRYYLVRLYDGPSVKLTGIKKIDHLLRTSVQKMLQMIACSSFYKIFRKKVYSLVAESKSLNNARSRKHKPVDNTSNDKIFNPVTGCQFKRYYYSCGCCTHWGRMCPQKKVGHKGDAMFKNYISGSDMNYMSSRT